MFVCIIILTTNSEANDAPGPSPGFALTLQVQSADLQQSHRILRQYFSSDIYLGAPIPLLGPNCRL